MENGPALQAAPASIGDSLSRVANTFDYAEPPHD
jgi:hypothetical protein